MAFKLGNFVTGPDSEKSRDIKARLRLDKISYNQTILKSLVEILPKEEHDSDKFYKGYLVHPIRFNVYAYIDESKDPQMFSMRINPPYTVYLVDDTINIPLYDAPRGSFTGELSHPVDISKGGVADGGKRISRKRTYRRKTRKVKSRHRV